MDVTTQEKWYRVALWQTPGIGVARFTQLLTEFGSAQKIFETDDVTLVQFLPKKVVDTLKKTVASFSIQAIKDILERFEVAVVVKDIDEDYPICLTTILQSPPVLYIKGSLLPRDVQAIAVVGTRKPTSYGLEVTRLIAGELATQGITIVSGLAYGIDAQAHQAALDMGGRTIAVLAHGLDRVYPSGNEKLARQIIKNGALVSAFPPGEPPSRGHFVARDEWIAMLSQGVLVTEGAVGSGALITASAAQKLGKPVFAVPGPITSALNHAPTHLLKSGAKLVTNAQDILSELGLRSMYAKQVTLKIVDLDNPLQQRIYEKLQRDPQTGDELARSLGVPIYELTSELTLMELASVIKQEGNQWRLT